MKGRERERERSKKKERHQEFQRTNLNLNKIMEIIFFSAGVIGIDLMRFDGRGIKELRAIISMRNPFSLCS
jgi:hypothetical protein